MSEKYETKVETILQIFQVPEGISDATIDDFYQYYWLSPEEQAAARWEEQIPPSPPPTMQEFAVQKAWHVHIGSKLYGVYQGVPASEQEDGVFLYEVLSEG